MSIDQKKCEHDACKCIVASDEVFCSPHCEQHAGHDHGAGARCDCGHRDCETAVTLPVEETIGLVPISAVGGG